METEIFQHYRVLRREDGALWELGRGAMAVTYKAFDVNLDCPVALKVVDARRLEDAHTRARFVREARAAAGLRHRNIATVYHLGQDEQSYFYAMEFVDGETVEDLVARRGPLPPAEALEIAAQVARALGAAAKQGLVHRDIKPANLMIAREDEEETLLVKVIDFGLARRAVTDAAAQITLGGFVGTPHYASPEQIEERDLDARSDIYSLGVTLWFMLTGRPTFGGPAAKVGSQHLHDEPPWATAAHLPAPVRALLARTLQKSPADRPQDPAALRREIDACRQVLADGVAATDTPPAPPPSPPGADPAEAETVAPAAPLPAPEGALPAVGEVLVGRFTLLEAVGEGRAGRVFRAGDSQHGGRVVAVKLLRAEAGLDRTELLAVLEGFRRLRAAPHPQLVEALGLDEVRGHWFAASEWVHGFTLVELLRHRGRLEPLEALTLLAQASDAAAHATVNDLRCLELASHQILVGFPRVVDGDPAREARAILGQPLAKWPRFGLKIDALALPHVSSEASDHAGSMTLVPTADAPLPPTKGYAYALGALLYELLSGTPLPSGKREVPPLPVLGEEANALLQRALSPQPGFRGEREFLDALLATCHLQRADLIPSADPPPVPAWTLAPSAAAADAPRSAALPMARTIRTKLLRPPTASTRANIPPRAADGRPRCAGRLVIILVTALVAVAVGAAFLLHAVRRSPAPAPQPTRQP